MLPDPDPDLGTLYLVPTPLGHPDDITARAVAVLGSVAVVACEDTRTTLGLLRPLGVEARLLSYHEHNEESRGEHLLRLLREGSDVAVVSDAGTPLVNDPGYRLVAAAVEAGVRVCPLPGANAPITALIGSGLPVHRFHYVGFLPRKSAARQAELVRLRGVDASLIFFEAPHRIVEALRDMAAALGERRVSAGRNLTRANESFLRGRLGEVADALDAEGTVRGQFTIVVEGGGAATEDAEHELAGRLATALASHGASAKLAVSVIREVTDLPRNWVYERVQQAQAEVGKPGAP